MALLLLLVLASASAWWFLRSRSSRALTTTSSQAEKLQDEGGDDGHRATDGYRHRSRIVEPNLTDDEFREKMLARDSAMLRARRAQMQAARDKLTLKFRKDIYGKRKQELEALVAKHGNKQDKNPRWIANDAIRQLRELEEDASY